MMYDLYDYAPPTPRTPAKSGPEFFCSGGCGAYVHVDRWENRYEEAKTQGWAVTSNTSTPSSVWCKACAQKRVGPGGRVASVSGHAVFIMNGVRVAETKAVDIRRTEGGKIGAFILFDNMSLVVEFDEGLEAGDRWRK